jgi:dCMP deaminase
MRLAQSVGEWSKDRSRKVGSVIVDDQQNVLAVGYNGFPRGVNDEAEARHARPAKYLWTEHAERNGIYQAARRGIRIEGCTMYLAWFPCMDCARAIVQVGIRRLVAFRPDITDAQWGEHFVAALQLFEEADTLVEFIEPSALSASDSPAN